MFAITEQFNHKTIAKKFDRGNLYFKAKVVKPGEAKPAAAPAKPASAPAKKVVRPKGVKR